MSRNDNWGWDEQNDWERLKRQQQDDTFGTSSCDALENPRKKKSKNRGIGKGILIGILIVLLPLAVLVGIGRFALKSAGYQLTLVSDDFSDLAVLGSKLSMIQQVIDSSFLFDYDKEELQDSVYTSYVAGLGDPYTCYYTAEDYQAMMESSEGTYYGIGVMISQEVKTGRVRIIRVFSGSPAAEVGLQEGDVILEVEGKEVTGMDLNEVVSAIKGAEGTTASVLISREGSSKKLTFDVERREVDVDTVYYHMEDEANKIGYLELTEFDSVSTDQFLNAIEDLKSQGMKGLILDLRNNPGGLLDVAVDLADVLIDTGVVVSIEDKAGNVEEYKADESGLLNLPLVVLINGDSASASEVLSGCIRDYQVGTLVGTQSFGKGIVQHIVPFSDGTAMKVTTAHYYTPNGNDIHGTGITPDIVVEDDTNTEVDEQLQAALNVLLEKNP